MAGTADLRDRIPLPGEEDIKPFRDVLLGLFFVTIGMLLDVGSVITGFGWVLLVLLDLLPFKAAVVAVLAR